MLGPKWSAAAHERNPKRDPDLETCPYGSKSFGAILGGSWVVIHGAITRATRLTSHLRGLISPLSSDP